MDKNEIKHKIEDLKSVVFKDFYNLKASLNEFYDLVENKNFKQLDKKYLTKHLIKVIYENIADLNLSADFLREAAIDELGYIINIPLQFKIDFTTVKHHIKALKINIYNLTVIIGKNDYKDLTVVADLIQAIADNLYDTLNTMLNEHLYEVLDNE